MTEEADRPFLESWIRLGAAVELAARIVEGDPAELVALLTTARKGIGTEGERSLLSAMNAIRSGAEAQVELANAAIAIIQGCAGVADDAALAALDAAAVAQ